MRYKSSQYLMIATVLDSKAQIQADSTRKKGLEGLAMATRLLAQRAAKQEAPHPDKNSHL